MQKIRCYIPNQQRTQLINFLLSSDTEILLLITPSEHANWCQTCKNVYAMCTCSDWAFIVHATLGGWVSFLDTVREAQNGFFSGLSALEPWMQSVHIPTDLPHCMPPFGGWDDVTLSYFLSDWVGQTDLLSYYLLYECLSTSCCHCMKMFSS